MNIVLDALSRLITIEARDVSHDNELNNVYAFLELNISNRFKNELYYRYIINPHFTRVLYLLGFPEILLKGDFSPKAYNINFKIKGKLLYYILFSSAL